MLFAILHIILQWCFFFFPTKWDVLEVVHSIKVCLIMSNCYSVFSSMHYPSIVDNSVLWFFTIYKQETKKYPGSCLLIHVGFPYSTVTDFVLMIHTASCPSYLCHAFQQTKHIPCPIIVFEHGVNTTSEGRSAGGSVDQLYMLLFFSLPEEQLIWDKGCFSSTHSSRMGAHAERTRADPQPPCGVMQKEMFLIIPTGILGSFNTIAEAENSKK